MQLKQVRELTPKERFFYWVKERYNILCKRRVGLPRPWSDDSIFQSTYFTNVNRENDKVTIWLRENVREPLRNKPEVVFAVICFRWFNYIPTGKALISEDEEDNLLINWSLHDALNRLYRLREAGKQIFTGAFVISNNASTLPKIDHVCIQYINPIWKDRHTLVNKLEAATSLVESFKVLQGYVGFGGTGFMAAQVIADLKYTYLADKKVSDWWTWAIPGPGSRRGMNYLLGLDPDGPVVEGWLDKVNDLREELMNKLPQIGRIHAQDTQNCLCEWSKYSKILLGGRTKRRYAGI